MVGYSLKNNKAEDVVENHINSLFDELVVDNPEVISGDLDPVAYQLLDQAKEKLTAVVKFWYEINQ